MNAKVCVWRVALVAFLAAGGARHSGAQTATDTDRRWLDTSVTQAERDRVETLVGLPAPAFADDMRWLGDAASLEDLFGKVVVVQFWNRGDRRGLLRLDQLSEMGGKSDDLVVIAVHTGAGAQGLEQFLERRPVSMPVVVDQNGTYASALGVRSTLGNLVIDRGGVVRFALLNPQGLASTTEILLAEATPAKSAEAEGAPGAPGTPGVVERPDPRGPAKGPSPRRDSSGFWAERIPDSFFPTFTDPVQSANDLRGKRGPQVAVERWVTAQPDATNKVIVAGFWATWCGPCVASIPHLNQLQESFRSEVLVMGVSAEPFETVRSWMPGKGIRYSIGVDTRRAMSGAVGNRFIPYAVVYSPDGVIRWQGSPRSLDAETLGKIVAGARRGASR